MLSRRLRKGGSSWASSFVTVARGWQRPMNNHETRGALHSNFGVLAGESGPAVNGAAES